MDRYTEVHPLPLPPSAWSMKLGYMAGCVGQGPGARHQNLPSAYVVHRQHVGVWRLKGDMPRK
jgi:hypothetical protein